MAIDPVYKKMETLENCVKFRYLRGHLGWTMEQVSYEMNFNQRRMLEWINARSTAMSRITKLDPPMVKKIEKQLLKDYPPPKPKKMKKIALDVNRVVKCLKEGKSLQEIAKIFRCKENDYRLWHNENLRLINQRMKKV